MMHNMMPYDMMTGVTLLWIVIGLLLSLLLVAAVTWLLAHWRNEHTLHQRNDVLQPQGSHHTYEQGYQPPEAAQEGGQRYDSSQPQYEQPTAQYPQEMPPQ
jgi:hypothetical protein